MQIGVIPGAGGTQRLPRLIGLPNAMEMITSGQPITSDKGFQRGLIDELVEPDQLLEAAKAAAQGFISGLRRLKARQTRNQNTRLPSAAEKKSHCGFRQDNERSQGQGLHRSL